jgi:hypothetical protein
MRRLIGLSFVAVLLGMATGRARAERVVAPLDALEAGNVDASVAVNALRTWSHVELGELEADGVDTRSGATLRAGGWIVDRVRLGLSLPLSLTAASTVDGRDLTIDDESGIGDLAVEGSGRLDLGKVELGLQAHLRLPTGEENHSSDSTDLDLELPVGYQLDDRLRAFAALRYELDGLSGDDDPDGIGISLGADHRQDALSLVAFGFYRRTFNEPEAIDGLGVQATAAYELAPGFSAGVTVAALRLLEVERPLGYRVSGTGLNGGLTLQYVGKAW